MSTLSEHTGNGNPPATSLQQVVTKEQLDGVLQHFDVLPSGFDRFLFKYIYVYLIGLLFLAQFYIPSGQHLVSFLCTLLRGRDAHAGIRGPSTLS